MSDVTLGNVADDLICHFCGSWNLEHVEGGWHECHDCSASLRYSQRLGEVADTEPPQDMGQVSELLHQLRRG